MNKSNKLKSKQRIKKSKSKVRSDDLRRKKKKKEKATKKTYPIVKCYWRDITTQGGCVSQKETDELETCNVITIGLLLKNTKEVVKIAASITLEKDEEFSDVTVIPKVVVRGIEILGTIDKENIIIPGLPIKKRLDL